MSLSTIALPFTILIVFVLLWHSDSSTLFVLTSAPHVSSSRAFTHLLHSAEESGYARAAILVTCPIEAPSSLHGRDLTIEKCDVGSARYVPVAQI